MKKKSGTNLYDRVANGNTFFMIRKYWSKRQERALNQSITTTGKKCL